MKNTNNGITLIALVITIIVLLILAGVAINMAIDSDGLFGKANTAAEKWNIAVGEEEETIGGLYGKLEEMTKDPMKLEDDDLKPELKTMILTVGGTSDFVLPIVKNYDGTDYSYNFTVDWGDGSEEETYNSNIQVSTVNYLANNNYTVKPLAYIPTVLYVATHSYTTEGVYQVKIKGEFDRFDTDESGEILEINQWGVTNTDAYMIENVYKIASPSKNTFKESFVYIYSNNIVNLPQNAFVGLEEIWIDTDNVEEVTIPDSITSVVYIDGQNLKNIQVQNRNESYSSINGVLYSKDKKTLIRFPEGREGIFEIPDGVTTIGEYAFNNCKIGEIKIPDSVTTIEDYAFHSSKIIRIIIPSSVVSMGTPFYGCDRLEKIYCRHSSKPDGWVEWWSTGTSSTMVKEWGYTGE